MSEKPPAADPWTEMLDAVRQAWPPQRWRDLGVVVGLSGGADSVALTMALCQLRAMKEKPDADPPRGFLIAAHFNHQLRGAESDADEEFSHQLASRFGIEFTGGRGGGRDRDEASLRKERLDFLVATAKQSGARYIALAHTTDDNVETVLYHLMRGTGPAGLAGIGSPKPIAEDLVIVRPLLKVRRESIRLALRSIDQNWREDSSNVDLDYRRNWLRHRVIPTIQQEFPDAVAAIARAIEGQRQWRSVIDQLADDWLDQCCTGNRPVRIEREPTASRPGPTPQPIVIAALQKLWAERKFPRGEMSRQHWLRLAETIQSSGTQRYALPGGIDVTAQGPFVELNDRRVTGSSGSEE